MEQYLNDNTRERYHKAIAICKSISDILSDKECARKHDQSPLSIFSPEWNSEDVLSRHPCKNLSIFGGFVRDTIAGVPFKDVDLWIHGKYSHTRKIILIRYLVVELMKRHTVQVTDPHEDIYYYCLSIRIDGIDFDICLQVNGTSLLEVLSDFSVNNLCLSVDTNTITTKADTRYTCEDSIEHIKAKLLYPIYDLEEVDSNYRLEGKNSESYEKRIEKRLEKLKENGYKLHTEV